MKKFALATAISSICVPSALADGATHYWATASSGTAQNPLASFVNINDPNATLKSWYVDTASGSASNKAAAPIQLSKMSHWTFDFTDPAAVAFTGTILIGDYRVQTAVTGITTLDGRQSFFGVVQAFSGVGVYDEATNTFTYEFLNPTINGGGASVYSASSFSTCANGQTTALGKVCSTFASVSQSWEGLALSFVFAEDRHSFVGSIQGTNTSGFGITRLTTTINWQITEVPVPATAWLFGSALLGLAGARRYRKPRL